MPNRNMKWYNKSVYSYDRTPLHFSYEFNFYHIVHILGTHEYVHVYV